MDHVTMDTREKTLRHVAKPCDDEYDGKMVRTWDVFHGNVCVAQGFKTRREARAYAKRQNGGS